MGKQELNSFLYRRIGKPFFFTQDPEKVHIFFIKVGKLLGSNKAAKKLVSALYNFQDNSLSQNLLGTKFKNPVGLSAGFDKNAEMISVMGDVGFGFSEVGSITSLACSGNKGIRLKRIPEKKAIWVNMGLNNYGVDEISSRLKGKSFDIPYGINVAKTNCKETANPDIAIKDYLDSLKKINLLKNSYVTLNISCPNAFGGQPFTDPSLFERLMNSISKINIKKPMLVKLSPDLDKKIIDKLYKIALHYKVAGFICSNLTKDKSEKSGGYSGKSVYNKSNELISYLYSKLKKDKLNKKLIIVGAGGIFNAEDAYEKIKLGASLVQLITGMIYEGPQLIGQINKGLVHLLKRDRYKNISEAVGKDSN